MKYRAEIDGLRAIAILPVILFHAGFEIFSGGYLGVDIFFVISGYIITSIILSKIDEGHFSILEFYEHRARRILPVLFLVSFLSIVFGYFILLPHQIKDLGQSIVATSFFVSNYFFYFETDYFNEFTNKAPLLHTWTLAVEEQFYIIYPLLLIAVFKYKKLNLKWVVAIILITSFVFAVVTVRTNQSLAFYSTQTRAWELMVGCLLAVMERRSEGLDLHNMIPVGSRRKIYEFLGFLALLAIIAPMFYFNDRTIHPGVNTLIPVVGTALVLLVAGKTVIVKSILSIRPMVLVGLLSYSLYMFHQPVISFLHYAHIGARFESDLLYSISIVLIIFLLSALSYRYFENPLRRSKLYGRKVVFLVSFIAIFVFSGLGYLSHKENGFQEYFAKKFETDGGVILVNYEREKEKIDLLADVAYKTRVKPFNSNSDSRILIIGDSMARDAYLSLYSGDRSEKNEKEISVRSFTIDDVCMDVFKTDLTTHIEDSKCLVDNISIDYANDLLSDANSILIAADWHETTYQKGYDLSKLIAKKYKAKVYVVDSIVFQDITSLSLDFAKRGITPENALSEMYQNIRWDRAVISDKLRSMVLADDSLIWINKIDFFCNLKLKECKVFDDQGYAYIWDNAHLTERAFMPYANFLLKILNMYKEDL